MAILVCPKGCEHLNEMSSGDSYCQQCGAALVEKSAIAEPTELEAMLNCEQFEKLSSETLLSQESSEIKSVEHSSHGETLVVAALLLPLVAQCVAVACNSKSVGIAIAWSTVLVTAALLAVDAAFLGTTDRRGTQHSHPILLFFGISAFWIMRLAGIDSTGTCVTKQGNAWENKPGAPKTNVVTSFVSRYTLQAKACGRAVHQNALQNAT